MCWSTRIFVLINFPLHFLFLRYVMAWIILWSSLYLLLSILIPTHGVQSLQWTKPISMTQSTHYFIEIVIKYQNHTWGQPCTFTFSLDFVSNFFINHIFLMDQQSGFLLKITGMSITYDIFCFTQFYYWYFRNFLVSNPSICTYDVLDILSIGLHMNRNKCTNTQKHVYIQPNLEKTNKAKISWLFINGGRMW